MRILIKKNISTLIFLFWFLYICANHIQTGKAYLHLPVAIVGCLIFVWAIIKYYYICWKILKPVVLFFICALVSILYVGNVPPYYMGFILGHIGVSLGLALTRGEKKINYKRWFFLIMLFYLVFYLRYKTFDTMYNLASENMVSVYLLLIFYLYCRENDKINTTTISFAVMSVILGYLAGSRIGLGCLLFLAVGVFFISVLKMKNGKIFVCLIFLTTIMGIISVIFFGTSILKEVLYDSPRIYIWNLYIKQLTDVKYVLLGAPFTSHVAFASYINNLHNTFMNVHARFGLIPLLTVVYMLYKCISVGIKERRWYIVLFTFLFILRSTTDNTSFSGPLDILIYTLYFDLRLEQYGYNVLEKENEKR